MGKSKRTFNVKFKARLILYDRGRILLLKQTRSNGGNYTLVGGTVENDEFARESLIRETREEANIQIAKEDLTLVHVLNKRSKTGQRLNLYFKASKYRGIVQNLEDHKFKSVQWFPINKLPDNVTATVRQALTAYRTGKLYSEQRKD